MTARVALWLPVVIGGATGAWLAIAGVGSKPAPEISLPPTVAPPTALPQEPAATSTAPAPEVNAASPAPSAASTAPTPSAEPAPNDGAEAAVAKPAFDLTPPATREDLVAVEVRCDRKQPEDCERAARALEAGQVVPRDAGRASMLRRIALTLYIKQCQAARAIACLRLSEMYAAGEYVQRNPRGADALRTRAGELCTKNSAQPGCG